MDDVAASVKSWREQDLPVALATVIDTWGSSPRRVGAKMAMNDQGGITGSVSGGCVEGAVIETAQQVLRDGRPQLLHFGVSDETAWDVGLACGGEIDVFVEPLAAEHFDFVHNAQRAETEAASLTVIAGPEDLLGQKLSGRGVSKTALIGGLEGSLAEAARRELNSALQNGEHRRVELGGEVEAFVDVVMPRPTLIMVGGVHIAVTLAELARSLGYRTVVIDPRRAFGSEGRFPQVDQLISEWPQDGLEQAGVNGSTAVAVLTHDPKIDDSALLEALPGPAFYVGALGSSRTQEKRRQRLREAGLTEQQVERLHGPIGLDIGARTPDEIALAVMAEVVAARRG